jgi:hypothetical protein
MRRGWKQFAERADKEAYAPEQVCDAVPKALEQDWRAEVSDRLLREIRTIVGDTQSSLFDDQRVEKLEALRSGIAGHPLAGVFLDCAIQAVANGKTGDEAVTEAASAALTDRAARGIRQVEEIYRRESTHNRAMNVRERMESGIARADISAIAGGLIGTDKAVQPRTFAKKTDLDDGVEF